MTEFLSHNNSSPLPNNQEIIEAMMDVEIVPSFPIEQLNDKHVIRVPLAELALAGGAFASMSETLRTITQTIDIPANGLFKFDNRGYLGHAAQMKDGSGFTAAIVQDGKGIVGNGAYVPAESVSATSTTVMGIDPTTLAISIALADASAKLNDIKEMQEEIIGILEEDKKAQLKGSIKFLADTLSNFKFNTENEKWLNTRQQEVVSIEREAESAIEYYRAQITRLNKGKGLLHGDRDVAKLSSKANSLLSQYQASLYMLGFATYVDIMLTEGFSSDYLKSIEEKLASYSLEYRSLYTQVYNKIERLSSTSIENALLSGASAFGKLAGGAIAKVPVISEGPVDEALIDAGNLIESVNDDRRSKANEQIISRRDSCIDEFRANIRKIDALHNKPQVFYLDKENVYYVPSLAS